MDTGDEQVGQIVKQTWASRAQLRKQRFASQLGKAEAGKSRRDTEVDVDVAVERGEVKKDAVIEATYCAIGDVPRNVSSPMESLFIFDWDDTLFPTTWALRQGLIQDNKLFPTACWAHATTHQERLETLANQIGETLHRAMQMGRVVIITNSEKGWVETSCAWFMPSLSALLTEVRIVSARYLFEHKYGIDTAAWKQHAFACEIAACEDMRASGRRCSLLSFGDRQEERLALLSMQEVVSMTFPNWICWMKSLKFIRHPTLEELISQHKTVGGCLLEVVQHSEPLDFRFTNDNGMLDNSEMSLLNASKCLGMQHRM